MSQFAGTVDFTEVDWGVAKDMKNRILIAIVGALVLLASAGVSANWTWTFSDTGTPAGSWTYDSNGGTSTIGVTASAWRNTTSATSTGSGDYGAGSLQSIGLHSYSGGLGAGDGSSPKHAVGNGQWTSGAYNSGDTSLRIESVLLSFAQAVTLSTVKFDWARDGDFTLAAYLGNDGINNDTNLANLEYSTLANHGWTTISNYYNAGTSTTNVNGGDVSSSYWLVSALNPKLGTISCCAGNDYFKLKTVVAKAVDRPGIPEPSTISLLFLGLLLAGYMSSQKRQRAAGRLAA